jgi:Ca2+-binding EF-hand superfamily protein
MDMPIRFATCSFTAGVFALALVLPAAAQEVITEGDLDVIDRDGDGVVTEAEYVAYMDEVFMALDVDGLGWISYDDIEFLLDTDERANIDPNRDGRITRTEFDAQMMRDYQAADRDGNGVLN